MAGKPRVGLALHSAIALVFISFTPLTFGLSDNTPRLQLASGQVSSPAQSATSKSYDYIISACDRATFASPVLGLIYPVDRVQQYLAATLKLPIGRPLPSDTKLTILRGFKYGEMVPVPEKEEGPYVFRYVPRNLDEFFNRYGGVDYAVIEVEMMGKRVMLQYKVLGGSDFISEDRALTREWDTKCPHTIRRVSK